MHKRCQLHQRPVFAFSQASSWVTEWCVDISAFPRGNTLLHNISYTWALHARAVFAVHKNDTFPQLFILAIILRIPLPSNVSW